MPDTIANQKNFGLLPWAPKRTPDRRFPRDISARRQNITMRDARRNARDRQYRSMVEQYRKMTATIFDMRTPEWTKQ